MSRTQRRQSSPCPPVLNVVGARVFQRKACARARAFGPRGIPGPLCGRKKGGPGGRRRSRTSARIFPCLEARGVSGPIPRRGTGRGPWPGEGRAWPVGPGYSVLPMQLRITTQVLPCRSKSGYPCYRVPTVAPGPTLGEVRTHRWGHYCDLASYSLKFLTAGVLTGVDHPSGCLLPHHITTAY